MLITANSIHDVQAKLNPIIGKKAWGVSLGTGSFITLEFGAEVPDEEDQDLIHGEWHLWITYCAWRLEKNGKIIAGSEDDRSFLKNAVRCLENLALISIEFAPPAWDTTFIFEEGCTLRLFFCYTKEYIHWTLHAPDGNVLTIGPGTDWWYESAELPRRM